MFRVFPVDFRFRRTLSAGEAEPPRSLRFCGVSTVSLFPLESPPSTTINEVSRNQQEDVA
jgi:hypothetical protein